MLFRDLAIEHKQLNHFVSLLLEALSSYQIKDDELHTEPLLIILQLLQAIMKHDPQGHVEGEAMDIGEPHEDMEEQMDVEYPEEDDLSTKLCTFTVTQNNFTEQHWYYCYTCSLTFSEGKHDAALLEFTIFF